MGAVDKGCDCKLKVGKRNERQYSQILNSPQLSSRLKKSACLFQAIFFCDLTVAIANSSKSGTKACAFDFIVDLSRSVKCCSKKQKTTESFI